jgi:hypothetical protein
MASIVISGFDDPVLGAEVRRAGADYLVKPLSGADVLKRVEQKLGASSGRADPGSTRRWARKQVSRALPAPVEDLPARIVDVSYGGLRFEIPRTAERSLPPSFNISLPASDFIVHIDLVWTDGPPPRHKDIDLLVDAAAKNWPAASGQPESSRITPSTTSPARTSPVTRSSEWPTRSSSI